ncbi:MAG: PAS domain S-box protein, partial [Deltaproteobacteria bacterium]|nr:PAS domain S-box protein [Deltaproteobacteria bacterium]
TFNRVYKTGKPTKIFDWEIIRKDTTKRYVETSVSLMKDSEGKPIGFRGIVRDITERKQAEEASRKAAALEILIQGYDNFIGDSLSNLLTPIYGHIELCEIRDSIDEIKGELGDIKGNITRLLAGINAYRKFSKAEESSLGKISSVDISTILGPLLSGRLLKTYGDEDFPIDPSVKLRFTYNPKKEGALSLDELPSVAGSTLAVGTTLQETLINAIESGGDVEVSARREDGNLIIKIADKGRGMSKEDRDKSQLPFFKVLSVKHSARFGLGAYIAHAAAKYCGGDIHIESTEGVGTTTSISFKVSDDVS